MLDCACNFYPRSPCGERRATAPKQMYREKISIHALLAESDSTVREDNDGTEISIHALLAESDLAPLAVTPYREPFLSTLSLRRATKRANSFPHAPPHFYPRSPCGERLSGLRHKWASFYFYPRSPCGERHIVGGAGDNTIRISIHALLAESDPCILSYSEVIAISIHALLAESDLIWRYLTPKALKFLSTLSLRRATM